MKETPNFGFRLPEETDLASINDVNSNFRNLDNKLLNLKEADLNYDPESKNAQSGKAVASALANYVSVDDNTEWIFDGGDAKDEIDIDFAVDNEMSDSSNNPVSNKVSKKYIDNLIENAIAKAKLEAHPIGSLYWSSEAKEPSELFGGTWERIKDRFILAAGDKGDKYAVGSVGGEAEVKLDVEHMPKHSHQFSIIGIGSGTYNYNLKDLPVGTGEHYSTGEVGGDQPHNNMPPYVAYYCWERKA